MVNIMGGFNLLIGEFGCFCWFLVHVSWMLMDFATELGTCGRKIKKESDKIQTLLNRET